VDDRKGTICNRKPVSQRERKTSNKERQTVRQTLKAFAMQLSRLVEKCAKIDGIGRVTFQLSKVTGTVRILLIGGAASRFPPSLSLMR
jgi:hypothetical protein